MGERLRHAQKIEALGRLDEGTAVDLLLTDMVLRGGMNGEKIAEAVLRRRSHARVLFSSGYTESYAVIEGDLGEGVAFLPKPYTQETLAHLVQKLLHGPAPSVSVLCRWTEPERRKAAGEERGIEP